MASVSTDPDVFIIVTAESTFCAVLVVVLVTLYVRICISAVLDFVGSIVLTTLTYIRKSQQFFVQSLPGTAK
jgi:Flp pilus assembly protein TadB